MERLEIIDSGRRRRFSREKKLQIVAESYSEPGLCATTARRHGISRSQLYEPRGSVKIPGYGHLKLPQLMVTGSATALSYSEGPGVER
ncbi:transposase [Mesorhizobium amorphae]|uniref:transposase n=1 Tax=Mesorhizobium amorphae TaxID=71433 RepID=UPI001781D7E8|nr:transposase [Mesorhizobium amorphae]